MATPHRWRFGPFEADAAEHRLLRDGAVVPVTRKAFALLAELLARPGRLVTKRELFDTVWAGTVVTDAALSRVIRELRVALDDDAAAPRYIATAHGLGFRFVALVSVDGGEDAAEPADDSAGSATPEPPRLVGREREFAGLDRALADARAGRRRVVFVTGEAGVGKTSLVEAFLERQADRAGLCVAQGRCIEQYGTGEAYLPILEALESIARQVGNEPFRDLLARYAPAWLAQLPWLAHGADADALQRSLADVTSQRMLREIAQTLEVLAAERPIVLWLEDLHWSDPSTLAVVAYLAGRRNPARLLLIASFRPGDALDAGSPLDALRLQLVQRGQAGETALELLDAEAVGAYLRLRCGPASPIAFDELAALVHRRTEGNALFMVAVVDDFERRGELFRAGDGWRMRSTIAALGDDLPDDLRRLVQAQIARLADDDRRLVEAAAVAGADFSAALVAAALQVETVEVEDRCGRLARHGRFLRPRPPVPWPDGSIASGFAFVHALYWQGAHEGVPEARRAEWQRRIGIAQERAYGAQSGGIAGELAMRFEAARDVDRTVRYLQTAGALALSRCAYHESIAHLRHALQLLPRIAPASQPRAELDLLLPLGAALMAVQGYAASEVEATYQRALVICRDCGRSGELERALRGLWNVLFSRSQLRRARAAADELLQLAVAGDDVSLTFDALGKLGHTCLHVGAFGEARSHLERALALPGIADGALFAREAPRLLSCLSWALWYLGFPDQASACAERALALAPPSSSPHTRAYALGYASLLHGLRGEAAKALALARQQREVSAERGLEYWRACSDIGRGWGEAQLGHAAAGAVAVESAVAQLRALGTLVGISATLCVVAEARLAAGQPALALAALDAHGDFELNDGEVRQAAERARLRGDVARLLPGGSEGSAAAEACYAEALAIARRQGARSLELRAATSLARLWADEGRRDRAVALLEPIVSAFDEGAQTRDPLTARALLAES